MERKHIGTDVMRRLQKVGYKRRAERTARASRRIWRESGNYATRRVRPPRAPDVRCPPAIPLRSAGSASAEYFTPLRASYVPIPNKCALALSEITSLLRSPSSRCNRSQIVISRFIPLLFTKSFIASPRQHGSLDSHKINAVHTKYIAFNLQPISALCGPFRLCRTHNKELAEKYFCETFMNILAINVTKGIYSHCEWRRPAPTSPRERRRTAAYVLLKSLENYSLN